ncbi:MAG: helix-turn-helix transcriptional regulator [Oscillospiraceae bacterium]|nr:helix-turn-helix transcriptional regulator [Oscillospiraceae bacterium]
MKSDFPRVLSLLRKEKGISQKEAASQLGVSQALLSHYEKGIRECGLDFLVRAADFYGVSADYLLGRSADPDGMTLSVEDIPEPDAAGKENTLSGAGVLPVINKKLIANSLNVLFDLLSKSGSKELTKQVSGYLMAAVYRMFRIIYSFSPKNNMNTFSVPSSCALEYADSYMKTCEAGTKKLEGDPSVKEENITLSSETLARNYPLFASSLFSLIKNCEDNMNK